MPDKKQEQIENIIIGRSKAEFEIDRLNHKDDNNDFEVYMNLYNLTGNDAEEEWQSNIKLPEFLSGIITQDSIEATKNFRRRDFIEIYQESKEEESIKAAEADKELINRTLNQPHIHFFQKSMRVSGLKNISGKAYWACNWERKTIDIDDVETEIRGIGYDIDGIEMGTYEGQIEANEVVEIPIKRQHILYDRFNVDVIHPGNIFTSPEYTYTLDEKKRVWVRHCTDINEMEQDMEFMGYINIDKVKEALKGKQGGMTQSKIETGETGKVKNEYIFTSLPEFDVVRCYCKEYVVLDKDGSIKPGIDEKGERKENAVLLSIVKGFAMINNKYILVIYERNKHRDPYGNPYCPIIRTLCYIHPLKDMGFGDGFAAKNLQTSMNDTYNLAADRIKLATAPALKAAQTSAMDFENTWNFGPRAIFKAYDPSHIQEMQISDDITGALNMVAFTRSMQQQASATFLHTMGGRGAPSESATAVAEASTRTDMRYNLKALTYEYTGINQLAIRIKWMTWQYALPETAEKLMGDKLYDFNPYLEHTYKPVAEAIETEYSKETKLNIYNNMFQQEMAIPNPNTLKRLNYIRVKQAKLLGDEFEDVMDTLFDENTEYQPQGGAGTPANVGAIPSNQTGMRQTEKEQFVRRLAQP